MGVPSEIKTELGIATIGVVKTENATKKYLCPLCDTDIDLLEEHLIAVPTVLPRLRRHLHTDCLTSHIEYGVSIKLHPKEPDIANYWLGSKARYNQELQ